MMHFFVEKNELEDLTRDAAEREAVAEGPSLTQARLNLQRAVERRDQLQASLCSAQSKLAGARENLATDVFAGAPSKNAHKVAEFAEEVTALESALRLAAAKIREAGAAVTAEQVRDLQRRAAELRAEVPKLKASAAKPIETLNELLGASLTFEQIAAGGSRVSEIEIEAAKLDARAAELAHGQRRTTAGAAA